MKSIFMQVCLYNLKEKSSGKISVLAPKEYLTYNELTQQTIYEGKYIILYLTVIML